MAVILLLTNKKVEVMSIFRMMMVLCLGVTLTTHAATLSWSLTAPATDGDDISNLSGVTTDANNIGSGNDEQTYVAGGRPEQGQTFTTGSNPDGYLLTSITLQHVKYTTPVTWYDLGPGWGSGNPFTIRVGTVSAGTFATEAKETAVMTSDFPNGTTNGTGTGKYVTLTFDTPVALDPDTTYAFTLDSLNPFFELNGDGTTDNNYTGGSAFTVPQDSDTGTATTYTGDRVFVAQLTAQEGLAIHPVGSYFELTWPSGLLLETTNLVTGPWVTNMNTSPYLVTPSEDQKFYRLLSDGFYTWPEYNPNVAYDYVDEFGIMNPPTEPLPDGTTGVEDIYTNGWWSFVYGTNRNSLVTENAWIPMVERFNTDFGYIADVLRWPRDRRAQNGYYSAIYLFGSGLSTDSASNTDLGGWQSATSWRGKAWPMALLSYYPVYSFDPACPYTDAVASQGASVHEGIHCILASMPGCYNSAWTGEAGNTWLQGTMEAQRSGDFSGMGWLSAGAAIAQFMPIECYSGWLLDGSFGGPTAEGVYQGDGICTWRNLLGGTQYGECFMYCMDTILGYQSVAWVYRNCNLSGRLLQDLAEHPEGLGPAQTRRLIQEFRGRAAMCDFGRKSYAYKQLLVGAWNTPIQEEFSPYWYDVPVWNATCYVVTTNNAGTLTPEARTLPGWSGANQIPLTVSGSTASVTFNPQGANMSCQLVYRDTSGQVRYSTPVSSGVCSIPLQNVLNNVVIAVICNTDYIYVDDSTRQAKFAYTLDLGTGVTGTADIYTKWFDYNPATYEVTAVATGPGSISSEGTTSVAAGGSISYTITPDPGYDILQVLAGGVPVGPVSSYTFNNVRGDVSIEAQFGVKTYRIYAGSSAVGSITPAGFTTVYPGDDQGYTVVPDYGWDVYALKVDGVDQGPLTSYTFTNVTADHNIKAIYVGNNPSVPQPGSLLYAFSTDTLATNGTIDAWDAYAPAGYSAFGLASPAVELINGVKWTQNLYADADGFGIDSTTTPIPCSGATIVATVKPIRNGIGTSWTSIVDCFYNDLVLGMRNDSGEVIVFRKGTQYNTGAIIPDGQKTVLSLVVQSTGTFKVYANGTQIYSTNAISLFNQLTPGSYEFMHDIDVGRGYDGWTTFNGNIGDVYIYTSALSTTDRAQLESLIQSKFGF